MRSTQAVIDRYQLTPQSLAAMIDHSFLRAYGDASDIQRLCDEARKYRFAIVAINPAEVRRCVALLAGCPVRVGAAVGFPLGQSTSETKAAETRDAIQKGAGEIDMVINVRALQAGQQELVREEIRTMVQTCRDAGAVSKVILETCYLTDASIRTACEMAVQEQADFVKTSTGFGSGGATVEHVRLMRCVVGSTVGVKAAGGIRDLQQALALIDAGATRLGTSQGVAIVEALRQHRS